MDEFIGVIKLFAGNFAPRGWMFCQGQLLPISQNQALFAILGTTYGGNGTTTFALPDLRGRVPIGTGVGPGLPDYREGQMGGSAANTLTVNNLPPHNHSVSPEVKASSKNATEQVPGTNGANTLAAPLASGRPAQAYNNEAPDVALNTTGGMAEVTGNTGGGTPVNNMPPYLGLNYIICLQGIFPPRE
ncbi:phage tail protein [Negadavirga shengliensis]|uniref:Phage tail protein n=1 Tax=Negadavirga shengliensis TaxID=1389218 RepID=A0ABV9T2D7_9BACT